MPHARNREGHAIHYRDVGSGEPCAALVMGIGVSGSMWGPLPEALARDETRPHRVLVIDNRGTGKSARPLRPWTMASMGDDVAAVLDHAGVERARLVGISLGGMIALHAAVNHPDRIEGLGLLCTTPGVFTGVMPPPKAVLTLVQGFANGMKGDTFMRLMYPESQLERVRKKMKSRPPSEGFASEPFSFRMLLYHMLAAAAHTVTADLPRVRCPTRVVTGAEDLLIPPENSRRIAARIPGASLEVLPEVGHDMVTVRPRILSEVLGWLDDAIRERAEAGATSASGAPAS